MAEIEAIVKDGVIIPTRPIKKLEGKKIIIKVIRTEDTPAEKAYAYARLLKEGIDAEEYFEI